MGTNIYASSRVELEFEECPYCHQNTATKFEYITAATGAWDIAKYTCLGCSRQYIKNIREKVRRPILVRASSDDGAYEYTDESKLWRTRLNYKVTDNKKAQDSTINKLKPCPFCGGRDLKKEVIDGIEGMIYRVSCIVYPLCQYRANDCGYQHGRGCQDMEHPPS